ncbi:diacylglycerol kinase family protein [Bhargavaea beijingensis]|uniref:Diacylglycerol kinase (ATP) n=1 Tax=Bhargavaea beijingensis TaxID=426756 RepID=A0A1G7CST2_9BACL|nr:diacylglycerol kinase family protein [Bhargavaea beijingensis]MCW1927087.1 diacylglycerol kinase family protein [Bhargavaea beijingensis]RSK30816.1 diacylglycerol kinase family protein [Bhargavaea beijingensis]SDE41810.1 diacylglycerol kinase (ATP) [Bhargavaea beijingensis]
MNVRKLFRSFRYAWRGVAEGLQTEQNFRFHLFAALLVTILGWLSGLSGSEWLIVILLFGGMFALELVNTAIERVVDLVSPEHHPLAGQAKDVAAGAVLVFAAASAVIGCIIFIPKWLNLF